MLGLSPGVQKLLVKGAWCLSKIIRKALCWPHCQIWRYFFQGLDDLFKSVFWSTPLTVGLQEDPIGLLGLRNNLLNWDGEDGKEE